MFGLYSSEGLSSSRKYRSVYGTIPGRFLLTVASRLRNCLIGDHKEGKLRSCPRRRFVAPFANEETSGIDQSFLDCMRTRFSN